MDTHTSIRIEFDQGYVIDASTLGDTLVAALMRIGIAEKTAREFRQDMFWGRYAGYSDLLAGNNQAINTAYAYRTQHHGCKDCRHRLGALRLSLAVAKKTSGATHDENGHGAWCFDLHADHAAANQNKEI